MEENYAQKQKFMLEKESKNRYKREGKSPAGVLVKGYAPFCCWASFIILVVCCQCFPAKRASQSKRPFFGSENWNRGQTCRKVRSAFGGVGGGSIWDPSPQHKPNLPQVVAASPRCTATNTTTST